MADCEVEGEGVCEEEGGAWWGREEDVGKGAGGEGDGVGWRWGGESVDMEKALEGDEEGRWGG